MIGDVSITGHGEMEPISANITQNFMAVNIPMDGPTLISALML
ncbi:MAG: hypothetical protein BWY74_02381 [Firmicutes bacterium ADurb.Bin419]|nr:MAG: hypothetical protein BWY74_02381 [Firmicutes bacterium ADurb.Bin419]